MSDPLLPGDPRALGGIRLLGRLGAGGMGQVYLGRTPGGRLVAVKTVHAHLADDPHYRERFRREAAAARAVTGAHTAAVLDADPDSAVPWLATAFLPGVTLSRAVARGGALRPAAVRALGSALAEALTRIHAAGLVHRDLKPSNVLVTADGPRVIDFGIARAVGRGGLTEAGSTLGTPGYLAPELIAGDGPPATAAADVFALGAVLAYAATGRDPFGTGAVAVLLFRAVHEEPDLAGVSRTAGLRDVVARCLDKDPASRPTVRTVLRALRDPRPPLWWREEPVRSLVLTDEPVPEPADAPPPAGTGPPPAATETGHRRETARRGLLLAGGAGLAGLFAYAVLRPSHPGPESGTGRRPVVRAGRDGTRWTLEPGPGAVRAMLATGSSLLVHGTDSASPATGVVEARAAGDGAVGWRRASDGGGGRWGVSGPLLLAPDLGLPAVRLSDGALRLAPPRPASVPGWFTSAGGLLIGSYAATSTTSAVRALDPATGRVRWSRPPGPATAPPAVLGEALLLAPAPGQYGPVVCAGVADGVTRWTYAPTGADGAVLALCASADRFALLTTAGRVVLLGAGDGQVVKGGGQLEGVGLPAGATALAPVAGTLLLAAGDRLYGFAPDDVRRRWSRPTVGLDVSWPGRLGGARAPVTGGGLLLHWRDADTLEALAAASGRVRWSARVGGGVAQLPPVVAGPTVYAAAGAVCTALRLADGRARTARTLPDRVSGLAADAAGWYARIGTEAIRAYDGPV
ncbi:protein kinase [Streptomyces sp. NPDC059070]|uniref:protein kinase domain-containing protein n=1 Tax=Streptomyces sp. NPDC059070 TaxID=3346713 RepID=UPI0036BC7E0F